jgi:hypothetical protein
MEVEMEHIQYFDFYGVLVIAFLFLTVVTY